MTTVWIGVRVKEARRIAYAGRIAASFSTLTTYDRGRIGRFTDADGYYFYPALARRYARLRE
jgi:hypothetical protein